MTGFFVTLLAVFVGCCVILPLVDAWDFARELRQLRNKKEDQQ